MIDNLDVYDAASTHLLLNSAGTGTADRARWTRLRIHCRADFLETSQAAFLHHLWKADQVSRTPAQLTDFQTLSQGIPEKIQPEISCPGKQNRNTLSVCLFVYL